MQTKSNLWKNINELRQTLVLAMPLIGAGLAQVGMEAVDVLMMGRLGPNALAAGALGSAIFISLLVVGMGIITAVGVLVARAHGAEDKRQVAIFAQQGLWLGLIISIPGIIIIVLAPSFLLAIGEDPNIVEGTQQYLYGLMWGFAPLMGFMVLREFVSALSKPRIVMFISLCAIPFNALANYILMYGKLGFPALGIAGIGYASSFIEWICFLAIVAYVLLHPTIKKYHVCTRFSWIKKSKLKEIILMGWPMGALFGFEIGLFSITTLMMGYFGAPSLAAHQIALECLSIAFMIPLGISQATVVRVSHALGGKHYKAARKAGYAGIVLGVLIAMIIAILFWSIPQYIIHLFINTDTMENNMVMKLAIHFLGVAAVFALLDAVQVVMVSILRGYKDTLIPMFLGLISYWLVGLGSGYLLGFHTYLTGAGLWWGLAIGITVSALLLLARFEYNVRRQKWYR